jgi:hypothetical protein
MRTQLHDGSTRAAIALRQPEYAALSRFLHSIALDHFRHREMMLQGAHLTVEVWHRNRPRPHLNQPHYGAAVRTAVGTFDLATRRFALSANFTVTE